MYIGCGSILSSLQCLNRHFRNERGTGAEMCPASVSGIVTGVVAVSVLSYKHSQKSWRKFFRPSFRLSCEVANLHLLYVSYTPEARSPPPHPTPPSTFVVRYWYVVLISKKESSSSVLGGSWMCQRFLRGVLASNTALAGNVIKNLKYFSSWEKKVVTSSKFSLDFVPPSMLFLILSAVAQ